MTTPAIQVEHVSKHFGSVRAVDDVSFRVDPGELFFLLGPSGCGKTTMLRILAGLETPDSGLVRLNGEDVAARPSFQRGAPMVFQNYALWPHLNVYDNVAFGLVERKLARAEIRTRVTEALGRVDLDAYARRMPGQLSGGQQQRVVLARALVVNPSIVLLDEPLSNLDARLRHDMREEIARLHAAADIAFVYVTHDQVEALTLADRMAVMSAGRLVASGPPHALYHKPPGRFCAGFLGQANLLSCTVTGETHGGLVVNTPFGEWRATAAPGITAESAGACVCMVRPENLHRGGEMPPGANRLDAVVETVELAGSTLRVMLRAGGLGLTATLLSHFPIPVEAGEQCGWWVSPEDTVVVADEA